MEQIMSQSSGILFVLRRQQVSIISTEVQGGILGVLEMS